MKYLKLALISIVFFAALLTAFSLSLPSQTNISRAIDINAPADSVYNYIANISKWKEWYANYDSSTATMSGATIGKGASLSMNKTTVTITDVSVNKVKAVWQSGNNNPVQGEFNLIPQANATSSITLQWNFIQRVKWYPWQKLASILSDKTLGPFMEKSLDNLKTIMEKQGTATN